MKITHVTACYAARGDVPLSNEVLLESDNRFCSLSLEYTIELPTHSVLHVVVSIYLLISTPFLVNNFFLRLSKQPLSIRRTQFLQNRISNSDPIPRPTPHTSIAAATTRKLEGGLCTPARASSSSSSSIFANHIRVDPLL